MKKYIGVKLVEAEPQRALQPSGSHEQDADGYKVKYKDGYVSWCPEQMFESQNLCISGKNNKISQDDVDAMIDQVYTETLSFPGVASKTTIVQCVLKNGFTITDSSACVDPANYDEKIGAEICMKKIKDKIWFLLGFLLQSAVYGFDHAEQETE